MVGFFGVALFVSSSLLFMIQPMFAKMVLPILGGTPAVWIGSMLFFQAALLIGYVYAHWISSRQVTRARIFAHSILLLVPLISLPIAIPRGWRPPATENPLPWLLLLLGISIGLPFLAISATAPLLQKWFSASGHRSAHDPYFLYRASNAGSMLGLLAYPLLIEPNLRLELQSRAWSLGYLLLVVLIGGCAALILRSLAKSIPSEDKNPPETNRALSDEGPTVRRRLRWLLLSFIPSSLMLGVTAFITTDIAAVPLLWVVPLALYLLSFVLVFGVQGSRVGWASIRILPFALLPLVVMSALGFRRPAAVIIPLHLTAFFVVALVCHGELSRDRPSADRLTSFYAWIAVGGALGGIFNAVISPLIFNRVIEYPLVLVLACLVRPSPVSAGRVEPKRRSTRRVALDVALPLVLGAVTVTLVLVLSPRDDPNLIIAAAVLGIGALVCFSFSDRPLRFGLGVAALLIAGAASTPESGRLVHIGRNFFGTHSVVAAGGYHQLISGNTVHGAQSRDPNLQRRPLVYYHPTGPAGQVLRTLGPNLKSVASLGLGAGSLSCYALEVQRWDLYEIDPAIVRIAADARLFTYLRDCRPEGDIILGDARLSLESTNRRYDLIVVDVFNSDAIPVHLITSEAIDLYLRRVSDKSGILMFHITNRYLDLEPVLASLANVHGLHALKRDDLAVFEEEKAPSRWVVMSRDSSSLGPISKDHRWERLRSQDIQLWTDDFSNIFEVFNWR